MWGRKTTRADWCTSHDRPLDSDGRCEADKELEERMSKSRFKVGDRVKVSLIDDHYPEMLGTIIPSVSFRMRDRHLVQFDEGSGAWILQNHLELVTESTDKMSSYETAALEELVDVLNPDDPFERVIMDMVATNRRKRADYAVDGSPWSNFDDTANALGIDGFTPVDSVNFNIEQKSARLRSLRKNGRMQDPRNESVTDTYLDRAVYAVIALAMHTYPTGKVEATEEDVA